MHAGRKMPPTSTASRTRSHFCMAARNLKQLGGDLFRTDGTCARFPDDVGDDEDYCLPNDTCPDGQVMPQADMPCPAGFEAPRSLLGCTRAAACFGFPSIAAVKSARCGFRGDRARSSYPLLYLAWS